MAAILSKAGPKVPASFGDVPVYFIKTGRKLLDLSQRILYKRVLLENYRHLVSLGLLASKPHLVSWLEQGDEPKAADIHGTRAAAGVRTGDGIENRTSTSKQKHCPQELPRTDPRAGNESQVARPTGETANRTGKPARSPQTGSGRGDQPGERGQGGSSSEGRAMKQRGDSRVSACTAGCTAAAASGPAASAGRPSEALPPLQAPGDSRRRAALRVSVLREGVPEPLVPPGAPARPRRPARPSL